MQRSTEHQMSRLEEVLAKHQFVYHSFNGVEQRTYLKCSCGAMPLSGDFPIHLAEYLTAAGVGDVREAKAQALEEAADGLGIDSDVSGTTIRSWLRARAFVIREGNA